MVNRLSTTERIERSNELGILLDDDDDWLRGAHTWRISTKGYVETTVYHDDDTRETTKLHHLVVGKPFDGKQWDHIDRNKLNNKRSNLRMVDAYTNNHNRDFMDDAKHIRANRGLFEVRMQRRGLLYNKCFKTMEEAIEYRQQVDQCRV